LTYPELSFVIVTEWLNICYKIDNNMSFYEEIFKICNKIIYHVNILSPFLQCAILSTTSKINKTENKLTNNIILLKHNCPTRAWRHRRRGL